MATAKRAAAGGYHPRAVSSIGRHKPIRSSARRGAHRAPFATGTLFAFAVGLVLAACGSGSASTSSQFLDTAQTRRAIEASILQERNLRATVSCPSEVVREKGIRFDCVATTPNGVKTIFHVVEADSRGYVEYSSAPEKTEIAEKPKTSSSTTRHKKP